MRDKKVIVLIVLTVLAAISLIYGVTASPKSRARKPDPAGYEREVMMPPPQQDIKSAVPKKRNARRSQFQAWKRNPFVSSQTFSTTSQLALNGIIWSQTNPKAMIGDAIVARGDTIGSNKVVDIQPNKVILNDGTKDFELTIEK